jgi:hypothetical protein
MIKRTASCTPTNLVASSLPHVYLSINPSRAAEGEILKKKAKAALPTSGRIGRFAQFLVALAGESTARKITTGIDKYERLKPSAKAQWWDDTMTRMEKQIGRDKAIEVMQSCGRKCCGAQGRAKARALYEKSSSVAGFLERLNKTGMGGGRLRLIDSTTIVGGYDKCYCGQVASATKPFASDIYCQCSQAWLEQYFSAALGCAVTVIMEKTIREGAKSCEFFVTR